MPSWGVHTAIANDLLYRIGNKRDVSDIEKNCFLLGNVLPDIKNGYIFDRKNMPDVISHTITHFLDADILDPSEKFNETGILKFIEKYKRSFDNYIVLGYLCHLIADIYWNRQTIKNHFWYEDGIFKGAKLLDGEHVECSLKEARLLKHKDFRYYGYFVSRRNNTKVATYSEELVRYGRVIEEICLQDRDVRVTLDFMRKTKSELDYILDEKYKNHEFNMFDLEELDTMYDDCVDYIYEYIKPLLRID